MARTLPDFLRDRADEILREWDAYARGLHLGLDDRGVRDDAARLLRFIAEDVESDQSKHEQREKSQGRDPTPSANDPAAGGNHAVHRHRQGFDINQLVAEYRALRATVTRLWLDEDRPPTDEVNHHLVRFNEAVDQLLAESVENFSREVETGRQLFLATLGHDLRSPLAAIHATAMAATKDPGPRPSDKERADRVLRASNRMRTMISDLLDFTRTQQGSRLPIEPEQCDLRKVIEGAVDEAKSANAVPIEVAFSGEVEGVWDCSRMEQLASNLITNAVVHGTRDAPIRVSVRSDVDSVELRVQNGGSTITESGQRTIFQPLIRGRDAIQSDRQGLGLGLYISKQIVEAHGGTISFKSSVADGTEVRVELPRRRVLATPSLR